MDYPDRDEFVVVKVTQILGYGVFAELIEYNKARGFVHISNVSSSWVKNIRNIVKINQVRVAKVINIDVEKRQIDLSFAGISKQMEKTKMMEFKQVNREEKLIAILARQEKKEFDAVWNAVADPLIEEYGSLHKAFEKVYFGEDISKALAKEWLAPVKELVEKNIVVSKKSLKGTVSLKCVGAHSLKLVKEVLAEIEKVDDCELIYGGAGTYLLTCFGATFKDVEKTLSAATDAAEKKAKKLSVEFGFKQDNEKQKR